MKLTEKWPDMMMGESKVESMNFVIVIAEMAKENVESHPILVQQAVASSQTDGGVAESILDHQTFHVHNLSSRLV